MKKCWRSASYRTRKACTNWKSRIFLIAWKVIAALDNDIAVLVSDRDKGLMTVEKEMQQDQLQGCVFTHCALHIAKNTGITKSEAITIITKMAKAPNAETFEKYVVELRLRSMQRKDCELHDQKQRVIRISRHKGKRGS